MNGSNANSSDDKTVRISLGDVFPRYDDGPSPSQASSALPRRSARIGTRSGSNCSTPNGDPPPGSPVPSKESPPDDFFTGDVFTGQEATNGSSGGSTLMPFPLASGSPFTINGEIFYEGTDLIVVKALWRGRAFTGTLICQKRPGWSPARLDVCFRRVENGEGGDRNDGRPDDSVPVLAAGPSRRGRRATRSGNTERKSPPSSIGRPTTGRRRGRPARVVKKPEEEEEAEEEDEAKGKTESEREADKEVAAANGDGVSTAEPSPTNQEAGAASTSPTAECDYFECPEMSCPRKYKHRKSLKHHLACAHQGERRTTNKRRQSSTTDRRDGSDDEKKAKPAGTLAGTRKRRRGSRLGADSENEKEAAWRGGGDEDDAPPPSEGLEEKTGRVGRKRQCKGREGGVVGGGGEDDGAPAIVKDDTDYGFLAAQLMSAYANPSLQSNFKMAINESPDAVPDSGGGSDSLGSPSQVMLGSLSAIARMTRRPNGSSDKEAPADGGREAGSRNETNLGNLDVKEESLSPEYPPPFSSKSPFSQRKVKPKHADFADMSFAGPSAAAAATMTEQEAKKKQVKNAVVVEIPTMTMQDTSAVAGRPWPSSSRRDRPKEEPPKNLPPFGSPNFPLGPVYGNPGYGFPGLGGFPYASPFYGGEFPWRSYPEAMAGHLESERTSLGAFPPDKSDGRRVGTG